MGSPTLGHVWQLLEKNFYSSIIYKWWALFQDLKSYSFLVNTVSEALSVVNNTLVCTGAKKFFAAIIKLQLSSYR